MNPTKTVSSTSLFLSLIRDTLPHSFNSALSPLTYCPKHSHQALWLQTGQLNINTESIDAENGVYCTPSDTITNTEKTPAIALRFIISAHAIDHSSVTHSTNNYSELIFSQPVNVTQPTMLLRLDQVDFPPAAVAYKHTHPGPGIRYMVKGGLKLVDEHGSKHIQTSEAWFEDAGSPVTAVAVDVKPSCFVRSMLLPLEFEGRSTLTLCDPRDADKPKLQTNIRHFEKRIVVSDMH